MTTVKYENKTVQVTENLPGKDFEKELIMYVLIKSNGFKTSFV
jgi:hypothetical protein